MLTIILLTLLGVGIVGVAVAGLNGGYVLFDDNSGSTFSYLTPGAGMTGESDTSNLIVFPEDVQYVIWWPLCDSGAADADADTLCFKLYGITPHGTYEFCDTIGGGIGAGGHWADAASDSSETDQFYSDTLWQHCTVVSDSSPGANPVYVNGLGWNNMYVGFRIIFSCTDTTDLGASLMYTYTTYGLTKKPPF